MLKGFLIFVVFCFLSYQSNAQEKGEISGCVKDNGASMPGTSVVLLSALDSSLIKAAVSDSQGCFRLTGIPSGAYRLILRHIGYEQEEKTVSLTQDSPVNNLGDLALRVQINSLSAVEIVAKRERPTLERTHEGMSFNVTESFLSAGENGFTLLRSLPGVVIDGMDNLLINGRAGVMVYVDGKPLYLDAELSRSFLRSISAANIESLELITNPSSKYDAQGSAAIINVKLKKNTGLGFNGNTSLSLTQTRYTGYDAAVNLNYKVRNVNFHGSYNYNYYPFFQDGVENRELNADNFTFFGSSSLYKELIGTNFLKTGIDWDINLRHTLSFSVYGSRVTWDMPFTSTLKANSSDSILDSVIVSDNRGEETLHNGIVNLHYKWAIDSTGKELQVNLDRTSYTNDQEQLYQSAFYLGDLSPKRDPLLFNTDNNVKIDIYAVKVDAILPFKKDLQVNLGLKSSISTTDNKFVPSSPGFNPAFPLVANTFLYDENINAGYASANKKWKAWSAQLGVRVENTNSLGESLVNGKPINRTYWNLFPSMFLQRRFDSGNQVNLSVTNRIARPDFRLLNPFQEIIDPYNVKEGNPYLKPELVQSYELSYGIRDTYFLSVRYSKSSDGIRRIPFQDPASGLLIQRVHNITSDENLTLSTSVPVKISDKVSVNNYLNGYYQKVSGAFEDGNLDQDQVTFNIYSELNLQLPKEYALQLSNYYISPFINAATINYSQANFSLGLRKSFFDGKLATTVRFSDIFHTNKLRGEINFQNQRRTFVHVVPTQGISVSLAYNFAKGLVFSRKEYESGAEEERNRTGKQ